MRVAATKAPARFLSHLQTDVDKFFYLELF